MTTKPNNDQSQNNAHVSALLRPSCSVTITTDTIWQSPGAHVRNTAPMLQIKAGEVGTYFAHSDCYIFGVRQNWRPWFSRAVVMANPQFFLPNERDVS